MGLVKLCDELGTENGIDAKHFHFELDGVLAVETGAVDLWVFDFFLEQSSEVSVLISAEVWLIGV